QLGQPRSLRRPHGEPAGLRLPGVQVPRRPARGLHRTRLGRRPAADPDRDGAVPGGAAHRSTLRSGDPPMNPTTKQKEWEMVDTEAGSADAIMDAPTKPTATVDARAKRIDTEDLDIYYGDFLAVKGVTVKIHPNKV